MTRDRTRGLAREMLRRSASQLLRDSGLTEPPYEPSRVAAELGIPVHDRETPGVDGYVEHVDGKPTIVLNPAAPPARKRFTLAHELGHVMLMRETRRLQLDFRRYRSGVPKPPSKPDPMEEWLCNLFAAELLMPVVDMRLFWQARVVAPSTLKECAGFFQVSLSAACRRAVESDVALHTTFWDTEPWAIERWSFGSTLSPRARRAVDATIATLAYEDTREELPDGTVVRAAPCGPRAILVVLSTAGRDRAASAQSAVAPAGVRAATATPTERGQPPRQPAVQPSTPRLWAD
jgi:Zn-dependent peptidase ImmA (M78 family)